MNRRNFLKTASAVPLAAQTIPLSFATHTSANPAATIQSPSTPAPMRERYELTLRRVLTGTSPAFTEDFLLADVRPTPTRRFTEYSGDLSGRYIGALATAARVYRTNFLELDSLVGKTISLQKSDGYFGSDFHYDKPTDLDLALLWGNGRLLVGLLEYYRYKPSPSVLVASKRLGDFLLRIAPLMLSQNIRDEFGASHFASSYICWTQQTEGLANLYLATKDARYSALAEKIAAVIERRPADHVHGYLTSLRGVMDLYNATSDPKFLRQCETAWQDVASSEDLLITGGVPEGWSPNKHRTEGCAEADWLRLNLALWQATGNPKYLSMAERTTFNEFALNQFATGDFGHRVLTETGLTADGAARAWWCCTLHGLRCFPDIHSAAFRSKNDALFYDLPIDSRMDRGPANNADFSTTTSSLAHDGMARITIKSINDAPVSLHFRKPEWADTLTILLNNAPVESSLEAGYAHIRRRWQPGDILTLRYGMSLRSQSGDKKRSTYSYGPWLLGAPQSDNPAYYNELTTDNKLSPTALDITQPLDKQPIRPFAVPIAVTSFPYTPAEFPNQQQTATLRAVAEQTGQPTTSWEWRFLTEETRT